MNGFISGIGVTGGFGEGITSFEKALSRNYPKPIIEKNHYVDKHTMIPVLKANPENIYDFFPARKLRRIDHFSKMALLACCLALEDAVLQVSDLPDLKAGIILATGFGAQDSTYKFKDSIIKSNDSGASPTLFSKSVHNAALANISLLLGIKGPGLTISQHGLSVPSAFLTASTWIKNGDADIVIVGGVDEFTDPLGYTRSRWRGNVDTCMPLSEFYHDQVIPGEGAQFFILSREKGELKTYGSISKIKTGNLNHENSIPDVNSCVLLSGNPDRLNKWKERNEIDCEILDCTPIYGISPITSGFDLAASALLLKTYPKITTLHVDSDNQYCMIVLKAHS